MATLQDYVKMAHIAEQAERPEDMRDYIKAVIEKKSESSQLVHLSLEERNLLSVAYKTIVSPKRNSWRTLNSLEQKYLTNPESNTLVPCFHEIKQTLETEMLSVCKEIIDLILKYLLEEDPASLNDVDDSLYYMKLVGDYYRYESEFLQGEERNEAIVCSEK